MYKQDLGHVLCRIVCGRFIGGIVSLMTHAAARRPESLYCTAHLYYGCRGKSGDRRRCYSSKLFSVNPSTDFPLPVV